MSKYPKKIYEVRKFSVRDILKVLQKGPSTLGPIYKTIKEKHPTYCGGSVKCICGHKETKRPEWKHQVRWALWDLRYNGTLKYRKAIREYYLK